MGTCRKLEFTGFALSNTAGGKGKGTLQSQRYTTHAHYRVRTALQRQRHTTLAGAHYRGKGRGTLQRKQAGTKLFWCHISENSAALLHFEYGNTVTLWGSIFGVAHMLSI